MNERIILAISTVIFVALTASSFVFQDNLALSTNMMLLGLIILILPYYMYKFFQFKRIRVYEKNFPSFLRDLAESQRAGLTILQAIKAAAKSDYGSLTEEIKKIQNQISWNIQFEKVLDNFMKRMKSSRTITRSIMIINQAQKSGGSVEDTMDSLATNIEMTREVQEEKKTLLSQQVIMMYAIFFIFLGISITLIKFMIPLLQSQTETQTLAFGLADFQANPCYQCIGSSSFACVGCDLFFKVSASFGFGEAEDPAAYYRSLFFTMVLVQGFFTGLIAGQIGSESVLAGVKHSLIMLASGFFTFIIVVRFGII